MRNAEPSSDGPGRRSAVADALERVTPGAATLARYQRGWLSRDVIAGLSLAALIVPAGMAYAELAALPPIAGLYASLVGLVAYAIFGPSRSLVLGPDSSTAPLVAAAIVPLAAAGDERLALGAALGILVGAMSLAIGALRLGFISDLLSRPVRVGYMNGLAIIVFVSQLPKLFGFSVDPDDVVGRATAFIGDFAKTNWYSLAIGVVCLAIILACRQWAPKVPGLLIAVVLAAVAVAVFGLTAMGVKTVGAMPRGLPTPAWPGVPIRDWGTMLGAAAGITVLTLADTTVLSRAFAARLGYISDSDQEFIAIGAANIAAGAFQGFPVSGSSTRTAVAVSAGAKSQGAGLVAAVTLAVLLVVAPGLTVWLPQSALAAVVIVAAISLTDVRGFMRLYRWRRTEFALSVIAFLGVVFLGVLNGVFVAIALSLLNFVRRQWRPHDAVLGRVPNVKGYHDIGDFKDAQQVPGLLIYRFDAPLFFANAESFRARVLELIDANPTPVRRVIVAAEPMIDVDTTAIDSLCGLRGDLDRRGIELAFAELKTPVRHRLESYGVIEKAEEPAMLYPTLGSAVKAFVRSHDVEWTDWEDEDGNDSETGHRSAAGDVGFEDDEADVGGGGASDGRRQGRERP